MNSRRHESEPERRRDLFPGGVPSDQGAREAAAPSFDELLDRLVDGELCGVEYRQLVRSLDSRPDGWRRCGLAFLEAQAWRQELGAVRSSETLQGPATSGSVAPACERSGRFGGEATRVALRWSAVAASWLVALGLGVWWMSPPGIERPRVVSPMPEGLAPQPINSLAAPTIRPYQPSGGGPDEVEFVMVGDHGDWRESKRMPVVSPEQHARESGAAERAQGDDVLDLLRRSGTDVTRREEFVPYVLPDGRQILLPVERVEVKPARLPAY